MRGGVLARALGNMDGGLRPAAQLGRAAARRAQRVEDAPRARRADAVEQLEQAEPAHLIGRVVGQAQQRDEVLDVGRVEVAQAAVLDERDAAARQLELEQVGVVAGAEQDGLRAQLDPLLARGEHPLAHLARLLALVAGEHELGRLAALALGPQLPWETARGPARRRRWRPRGSARVER